MEDFAGFYSGCKDRCLRALVVAVGRPDLAEDLLAEAFARAYARWPAVRKHPAPEAWVMRTALNLNVSWWRHLRRERPLQGLPEPLAAEQDQTVDLMRLLALLPARQRQVLGLRVFLDLDARQTSEVLGIAEGTVRAHLHRATTALRPHLTIERTLPC